MSDLEDRCAYCKRAIERTSEGDRTAAREWALTCVPSCGLKSVTVRALVCDDCWQKLQDRGVAPKPPPLELSISRRSRHTPEERRVARVVSSIAELVRHLLD
jgi:hypothetical protein